MWSRTTLKTLKKILSKEHLEVWEGIGKNGGKKDENSKVEENSTK